MFSCLQEATSWVRHLKLVVVCAIRNEPRCNPPKPDVDQRSSPCDQHDGFIFFQTVLKQARCWCVTRNDFIAAALVNCGNSGIDDWDPKSPGPPRLEGVSTWESEQDEANQLKKNFSRKRRRNLKSSEHLLLKSGCIYPAGYDRETTLHDPRFLWAEERHANSTARIGNSLLHHEAAQKLRKAIPRVKRSAIPTDGSLGLDILYEKENVLTEKRWYYGGLQGRRYGQVLTKNAEIEHGVDFLASQAQSSKTPFLKEASVVHRIGKKSLGASLISPVSLERRTKDLLRQLDLPFCGAVGISFALDCVSSIEEALRWGLCGLLTVKM